MEQSEIIEKIKNLRSKKGLSLGQLSKRAGLSKGYLSKIENAASFPPISTLHRIATALGVDLVYFFSENHLDQMNNKIVVRRNNERKEAGTGFQESRIRFWPLADQKLGRNMDPYIVELPQDHDWIFQFEGEEFNLLLEGKAELRYGDERYILEEGDSVYIDGDIPYSGKSIGDKPAKVLSIIYRYKKVAGDSFSDAIMSNKFKFHRSSNT